jgi:hypothetical protein
MRDWFFGLLAHDCLMSSPISSDANGPPPFDFCFQQPPPPLPVSLHWAKNRANDLSVGASVRKSKTTLNGHNLLGLDKPWHPLSLLLNMCHLSDWLEPNTWPKYHRTTNNAHEQSLIHYRCVKQVWKKPRAVFTYSNTNVMITCLEFIDTSNNEISEFFSKILYSYFIVPAQINISVLWWDLICCLNIATKLIKKCTCTSYFILFSRPIIVTYIPWRIISRGSKQIYVVH